MSRLSLVLAAAVLALAGGVYFEKDRLFGLFGIDTAAAPAADNGGRKGRSGAGSHGPVPVRVVTATTGTLPVTLSTVGSIVPINSTSLSSPAAGIVAEVAADSGASVKTGDLIVRLDTRALEAAIARDNAQIARDDATLGNAQTTFDRNKSLLNKGAVTQQALDDANAALQVAQGTVDVGRATLVADKVALANAGIRAPFDGRLGVMLVSKGAYVAPGTPVARLIQMAPVLAEFALPETSLDAARAGLAAGTLQASVTPVLAGAGTQAETGPVVFLDNSVDPDSGTFLLRARLDNADAALWPGQALNVVVKLANTEPMILVPTVALRPKDSGWSVSVMTDAGKIAQHEVTVALREGATAAVSMGLATGDRIVVEGMDGLADGTAVVVADAPVAAKAPAGPKSLVRVSE